MPPPAQPATETWSGRFSADWIEPTTPPRPDRATGRFVLEREAGLKNGTFNIWKGPIVDQSGKTVVAAGQVADDKFLHGITFYVKGVEGKVPGQ